MKPKQMFIVLVIILLATTLLFPKTREEKHCDQYSGQSNTLSPTDEFKTCNNDSRCMVDTESIFTRETDEDEFSYSCVPVANDDVEDSSQLPE